MLTAQDIMTKEIFKKGAYSGFLGAAAGSLIGAAVGIVTGDDVAGAIGKGAAVGAAAGATMGGIGGYTSEDARKQITRDLHEKSLENKAVESQSIAHGFLFFPGEAMSVKKLRLKLMEKDNLNTHLLIFEF